MTDACKLHKRMNTHKCMKNARYIHVFVCLCYFAFNIIQSVLPSARSTWQHMTTNNYLHAVHQNTNPKIHENCKDHQSYSKRNECNKQGNGTANRQDSPKWHCLWIEHTKDVTSLNKIIFTIPCCLHLHAMSLLAWRTTADACRCYITRNTQPITTLPMEWNHANFIIFYQHRSNWHNK